MVKVKNVLVDPANHTRKSLTMPNKRFGGGGGRGRSAEAKKFNAAAACSVHSVYLIKAVGKNGLAKPCFQMCVLRTVFLTTYFDVQTQPVGEGLNGGGGGGGGGGHDVPAGADAAGAAAKAPKAAPSESPSEIPAAKVIASSVHRFFNNRVFRCVMRTVFLTTYFDVQTQPVVECPRDIGGGGGGGGHDVSAGADAAGAAAKAAPAAPPAPSDTGGGGLKELRGDDAAGAAAKAAPAAPPALSDTGGGGLDELAGDDAAAHGRRGGGAAATVPTDAQVERAAHGRRGGGAAGANGVAAKATKAAPSESPSEIPAAKVIASSVHRFFNNSVFRCVMKTVFLTTYFDVLTQTVGDAGPADPPAVKANAAAAFSVHSFLNDQGCCEQLLVKTVFSDLF